MGSGRTGSGSVDVAAGHGWPSGLAQGYRNPRPQMNQGRRGGRERAGGLGSALPGRVESRRSASGLRQGDGLVPVKTVDSGGRRQRSIEKPSTEEMGRMSKFLCLHTVPPNGFSREQIGQFAQAAQNDPVVKGYRSFCSLSAGKVVCVLEAPNKEAVSSWFEKMKLPFDSISPLELEGDRGTIQECAR
jgi:hypothetical protein